MGWELVAEGGVMSLPDLAVYEPQLPEGSYNLLELDLRLPVSQDVAQELEDTLRDAGVEGVRVTTASPMLRIYFDKGFPWLAVIAAAVLASIVLTALIVAWRLFTYVGGIAPGAIPLLAIAGILFATGVIVYAIRRA